MKRFWTALAGIALLSLGLVASRVPATEPEPAPPPLGAVTDAGRLLHASPETPRSPEPLRWSAVADPGRADTVANAVVREVCTRCHNDERLRGNLSLERFDADRAGEMAETAEKMIRKLRAGLMPPPGTRRPDEATLTAMAEELEARVDAVALAAPNPGSRTFQRLNRAEYERAIRNLLGLEVDAGAFLPTETISDNFDNIADVQTLSATLMEGYLRAAGQIARMAVGDPDAGPRQTTYKVPKTASQMERAEGAPLGTRGGISVVHVFPADGDYVFKLDLHPGPTGFLYGMTSLGEQLEVSINGVRAALLDIDPWMSESDPMGMVIETRPIHVRAGPQRVTAAFLQRAEGPVNDLLTPVDYKLGDTMIGSAYGVTTVPHLRDLIITGPHRVTGISDTPSRRRIFSCRPTAPDEARPCAEAIISRLGTEAYRRPLTPDDLSALVGFYDRGAAEGGFETGVRTALQAVLASPHFVFRLERAPSDLRPGEVYRISDVDLASRLSFFLWGGPPDAELRTVAERGELSEADVLRSQARRLLSHRRAEALATRFASQWFRLQDLDKIHPDPLQYPYWDHTLAEAMRHETQRFFEHLVREDRGFFELLTADYTFVNERLARHYGIPGVAGTEFRRVTLQDENRRGILGHGSILTLTSHADRTSPVLRGKWVLEVLFGSPPPPPPPDIPDLEATDAAQDGRFFTVRERLEMHRSNPACRSCHRVIDPIGLALENFDVTGGWRIKDEGRPVDATGELYDGTPLSNAADLRRALLARPEALARNFTENLMAYALGRRVEYYDMPTVREIARQAAENDYRMSEFILGVVESPAFRMSAAQTVAEEDVQGGGR